MLWTDERLQQVIAQYTPVLYLHEEERYLPCSVDWYIKRSQLWLEEPVEHVSKFWGRLVNFCVLAACMFSLHVANCFAEVCHNSWQKQTVCHLVTQTRNLCWMQTLQWLIPAKAASAAAAACRFNA